MTLSTDETNTIIYQSAGFVVIVHLLLSFWALCFARVGHQYVVHQEIILYDSDIEDDPEDDPEEDELSDISNHDSD